MTKILISNIIIFVLSINFALSQVIDDKASGFNQEFSKKDLTEKVLSNSENDYSFNKSELIFTEKKSTKSTGLAFIYSLLLPGTGHLYTDRMDVGKYFVAAEISSWLGVIGLTLYGDAVQNDARSFAGIHASLIRESDNEDYYRNIGEFNNIYDYNDEKLRRGEYELIYDVNKYFWNWDNVSNREEFDSQRRSSERIYNSRIVFATGLVVNRIVSAISALILANDHNANITSFKINSEFIGTRDNPFDGIKLNFVTEF